MIKFVEIFLKIEKYTRLKNNSNINPDEVYITIGNTWFSKLCALNFFLEVGNRLQEEENSTKFCHTVYLKLKFFKSIILYI